MPSPYLEDEWQVVGGRRLFPSSNFRSPEKGHLLWKTQCMHSVWHVISMESFLLLFLKKEDVVVESFSHVQLYLTPWTAAYQAPLFFTISQSLLKLVSIELVMPSNHLVLCHLLLLLPSIFPSIKVFSNESGLRIRWPKYWSFSFSICPSSE